MATLTTRLRGRVDIVGPARREAPSWFAPRAGFGHPRDASAVAAVERAAPDTSAYGRPLGRTACVYGVPYTVWDDDAGGTLYVTPFGLPLLEHLRPETWLTDRRYATHGQRLACTVYRLDVPRPRRRPFSLVVKFSRFAQDVPLDVHTTFEGAISAEAIGGARFLDPFQEFGLLMELRQGRLGPANLRIGTKRPLAIYRVPQPEPAWRLGRKDSDLDRCQRLMQIDQRSAAAPVSLDGSRTYVVLYHWVRGLNLLEARDVGLVAEDEVEPITRRVAGDLLAKGFMVLDHKPQHIIVRPSGDGLLHRRGRLAYALVDFELLTRTAPPRVSPSRSPMPAEAATADGSETA